MSYNSNKSIFSSCLYNAWFTIIFQLTGFITILALFASGLHDLIRIREWEIKSLQIHQEYFESVDIYEECKRGLFILSPWMWCKSPKPLNNVNDRFKQPNTISQFLAMLYLVGGIVIVVLRSIPIRFIYYIVVVGFDFTNLPTGDISLALLFLFHGILVSIIMILEILLIREGSMLCIDNISEAKSLPRILREEYSKWEVKIRQTILVHRVKELELDLFWKSLQCWIPFLVGYIIMYTISKLPWVSFVVVSLELIIFGFDLIAAPAVLIGFLSFFKPNFDPMATIGSTIVAFATFAYLWTSQWRHSFSNFTQHGDQVAEAIAHLIALFFNMVRIIQEFSYLYQNS